MEGKTKKKNQIVKESNALARARIRPAATSVWDMRVIATVAARNTTRDELFREHTLDLREFNRGEELSTDQTNKAKTAIQKLSHKTYEIPLPRGFDSFPIFARLKFNNGIVTAEFNEKLKPHYLNLRKCFTQMSLPDFQKLTSIYAQKMYEILSSWRSEREVEISLENIQALLNVPASFTHFSHFKTKVLEVAHKEINAVAENSANDNPLEYDWEPVKEGQRKVVAIRFILNIRARKNLQMIEETRKKLKGISEQKAAREKEERRKSDGNEKTISEVLAGLGLFLPPEQKNDKEETANDDKQKKRLCF